MMTGKFQDGRSPKIYSLTWVSNHIAFRNIPGFCAAGRYHLLGCNHVVLSCLRGTFAEPKIVPLKLVSTAVSIWPCSCYQLGVGCVSEMIFRTGKRNGRDKGT